LASFKAGEPGTTATPAFVISARERTLSPIASIASGGGTDENDARIAARAGEFAVFGQETVAWVDRLGPASLRYVQDLVDA